MHGTVPHLLRMSVRPVESRGSGTANRRGHFMRQLVFRILPLATLFLTVMTGSGCTQAARRARHLARANQYFDSGELDKAEIEYLIVLKTDLTNAQAIGRLGMIYYEQGRYGRAV